MNRQLPSVLILDDEEIVRESLADYFEDHGWRVLLAATGEEGLDILERETPDCAVVDIRLPGINGNEFIRKARALHPEMGFVVCTGSPNYRIPEDVSAFPSVRDAVFYKPIADISLLELELQRLNALQKETGDSHA